MVGVTESGAKVATTFIESFKQEPLSLALVAMNGALLGLFWFIMSSLADIRAREMAMIYKDHEQVREILSKCVVPGGRTAFEKIGEWTGMIPGLY